MCILHQKHWVKSRKHKWRSISVTEVIGRLIQRMEHNFLLPHWWYFTKSLCFIGYTSHKSLQSFFVPLYNYNHHCSTNKTINEHIINSIRFKCQFTNLTKNKSLCHNQPSPCITHAIKNKTLSHRAEATDIKQMHSNISKAKQMYVNTCKNRTIGIFARVECTFFKIFYNFILNTRLTKSQWLTIVMLGTLLLWLNMRKSLTHGAIFLTHINI